MTHKDRILRRVTLAVVAACAVLGLAGCGDFVTEPSADPPILAAIMQTGSVRLTFLCNGRHVREPCLSAGGTIEVHARSHVRYQHLSRSHWSGHSCVTGRCLSLTPVNTDGDFICGGSASCEFRVPSNLDGLRQFKVTYHYHTAVGGRTAATLYEPDDAPDRPTPPPSTSTPTTPRPRADSCPAITAERDSRVRYSGECHSGSWSRYTTGGGLGRGTITVRTPAWVCGHNIADTTALRVAGGNACRARNGRTEGTHFEWAKVE